jgi:hypothetical protein
MVHRAADSNTKPLSPVSSAVGGTGFGNGQKEEGEKNGDLAGSAAISPSQ